MGQDIENPAPVMVCPFCEEPQEGNSYGLDVLKMNDEGWVTIQWLACCEGVQERVGAEGWAAVWGEPLLHTVAREILGCNHADLRWKR